MRRGYLGSELREMIDGHGPFGLMPEALAMVMLDFLDRTIRPAECPQFRRGIIDPQQTGTGGFRSVPAT